MSEMTTIEIAGIKIFDRNFATYWEPVAEKEGAA